MTFPFHDKILFSSFDRVPTPISSTYSTAYANVMGLKKKFFDNWPNTPILCNFLSYVIFIYAVGIKQIEAPVSQSSPKI